MQATPEIDLDKEWAMIEAQLPENWRELADEARLIPAWSPGGAVVKDVNDVEGVLRLIFYHVATNASLRVTTAMGVAANIIEMSSVALHLWMKKIGGFMATLLDSMTTTRDVFAAERWAGYDIQIVDASSVQRPGACETTARVHYQLQLTSLRPTQIVVTDEHVGETFKHFEAAPGQLFMGDRVYANPDGVASITSQGADVLVRYNRGSLPLYDAQGTRMDIFEKFKKLSTRGSIREWIAYIHPSEGDRIRGRLCMVRLPADKAKEARERTRKEYSGRDKKITAKALRAAEFVTVFTTVPKERLSKKDVMTLYRLRWQVELAFKREKSIAGLHKLPNFRNDTIYTWICTKLLLSQIARKIASPKVVLANILNPKLPKPQPLLPVLRPAAVHGSQLESGLTSAANA